MPEIPSETAESLVVLSQFFVGDRTLSDTVQRVVELASEAVPKAAMTGITMGGRVKTSFFTDPDSREIDQATTQASGRASWPTRRRTGTPRSSACTSPKR